MNHRSRVVVLAVSVPVIAFAAVGGVLSGRAMAREESYQYLRIFEDVVALIVNNYVEKVDVDKLMHGAMHGLADGLDPDTAYLDAAQLARIDKNDAGGPAVAGLELTRQYYLRVIAARDGSSAARAGLMPGDYIRAINGQSTRDTSVFEGQRLLRGKAGTKVRLTVLRGSAAEPHDAEVTLEELAPAKPHGRIASPGMGVLRIAEFTKVTADQVRAEVASLSKAGASRLVVDVRATASGDVELGVAVARLFVPTGILGYRQDRGKEKDAINAVSGDGAITLPMAVLTDNGTSGAAEVFAAALSGNKRATLIGERTSGRAARQKVVRLPDGNALLLTHLIYLGPGGTAIHEKGLTVDVAVEQPSREFGQPVPAGDPTLDKAVETLAAKPAA